jgi:hypothetical protein
MNRFDSLSSKEHLGQGNATLENSYHTHTFIWSRTIPRESEHVHMLLIFMESYTLLLIVTSDKLIRFFNYWTSCTLHTSIHEQSQKLPVGLWEKKRMLMLGKATIITTISHYQVWVKVGSFLILINAANRGFQRDSTVLSVARGANYFFSSHA